MAGELPSVFDSMTQSSTGSILAVGGAEDKVSKRDILERFVTEAGGPRARIAILPTASLIPAERSAFYRDLFTRLGALESFPVPIASRRDAESRKHAESIERATGVFLTGGTNPGSSVPLQAAAPSSRSRRGCSRGSCWGAHRQGRPPSRRR